MPDKPNALNADASCEPVGYHQEYPGTWPTMCGPANTSARLTNVAIERKAQPAATASVAGSDHDPPRSGTPASGKNRT